MANTSYDSEGTIGLQKLKQMGMKKKRKKGRQRKSKARFALEQGHTSLRKRRGTNVKKLSRVGKIDRGGLVHPDMFRYLIDEKDKD